MRTVFSRLAIGAFALVTIGCSSPAEKVKKCKTKCPTMKSTFAKRLCNGLCERKVYGEFDDEKLESLCKDGDGTACMRAANTAFKEKNAAKLDSLLSAGCDKGHAECCGLLGKAYRRGKVMKKNEPKGYELMIKACNMGDASSCASPGFRRYKDGKFGEAKALWEKGCAGDAKMSCSMMGMIYRDGKGVAPDRAKAKKYFRKSCSLGYKTACKVAGRL